uniref:Metallo-beta-lactamase superfamily protein n=1 Tax=Angiostrongylus cantonensis TaxID=6313 RepID=A0A0K0D132_ANGCA
MYTENEPTTYALGAFDGNTESKAKEKWQQLPDYRLFHVITGHYNAKTGARETLHCGALIRMKRTGLAAV